MANTNGAIARITKEIAQVQRGNDLSLAVAVKDSDVRNIRALIIGPPETPYEYGFFEFECKMSKEYPIKSPHVRALTTNGGRTRFNPNIYAEGKVCLSILGTWRGYVRGDARRRTFTDCSDSEPGEQWSSAQGLESVLLSIQSLMSSNPYENEPGFEAHKKDQPRPKAYAEKIRHETIRISIVERLENLLGIGTDRGSYAPLPKKARTEGSFSPSKQTTAQAAEASSSGESTPVTEPSVYEYDADAALNALEAAKWDPFADVIKRRFLWYYDSYVATVTEGAKNHKAGEPFEMAQFEHGSNTMSGQYDYPALKKRLEAIKLALEDEEKNWVKAGVRQVSDATQQANMLAFQFKQLEHQWNERSYSDSSRLEISLPSPQNPFLWHLTLFGKPMTNLDGGIWNMHLFIPPKFPEIQPRLRFLTPIFHHRMSKDGVLCYFPKHDHEIASHIDAIVQSVDDVDPIFDPRAVLDPEAFGLYWGGEEKRKVYSRRLRRSAQDSSEFPG